MAGCGLKLPFLDLIVPRACPEDSALLTTLTKPLSALGSGDRVFSLQLRPLTVQSLDAVGVLGPLGHAHSEGPSLAFTTYFSPLLLRTQWGKGGWIPHADNKILIRTPRIPAHG